MWLQLGAHLYSQCSATGTTRKFVVPKLQQAMAMPKQIEVYMVSAWRRNDMPLLEFMRKTNDAGQVLWARRINQDAWQFPRS